MAAGDDVASLPVTNASKHHLPRRAFDNGGRNLSRLLTRHRAYLIVISGVVIPFFNLSWTFDGPGGRTQALAAGSLVFPLSEVVGTTSVAVWDGCLAELSG